MPRYAAFLRAVNLGGGTRVSMGALGATLARAGYREVRTLLQSGNVVLRADPKSAAEVEAEVEGAIARSFGYRTDVFVRSPTEWHNVVSANPFPRAAGADPSHLTVLVLRAAPAAGRWADLARGIVGSERLEPAGRHGYLHYPDGIGRSRLTLDRIERALGTRGTLRNWNTVSRVDELLRG